MKISLRKIPRSGILRLLMLCISVLCLNSCITAPFLKKGQYLLINQKTKGNKNIPNEELEVLFHQKANRKILGTTPYLGFYFFGKSIWDTNRVRRQLNEKLAYYNNKIADLPPGSFKDSMALEVKKESRTKKYYIRLLEGNWWMVTKRYVVIER